MPSQKINKGKRIRRKTLGKPKSVVAMYEFDYGSSYYDGGKLQICMVCTAQDTYVNHILVIKKKY